MFKHNRKCVRKIKTYLFAALAVLIVSLNHYSANANPAPKSYELAVLGDSRTEAVFADIPLGQVQKPENRAQAAMLEFFFKNLLFVSLPRPTSDELTLSRAHMKRVQAFFSRRNLSGLAGTKTYSLPVRLSEKWGLPVEVKSFAEPGLSYLVASQSVVFEMAQALGKGASAPQAVVIELGAVDFLIDLPAADFDQAVSLTLNRLRAFLPDSAFYLSSLPPIVDLFLQSDHPATFDEQGNVLTTCKNIYDQTGYGHSLKLGPDAQAEVVEKQKQRFADFNKILAAQVAKLNDLSLELGYKGKAVVVNPEEPEDLHSFLAFDCLHPNPAGQAKTANAFFQIVSQQSLND